MKSKGINLIVEKKDETLMMKHHESYERKIFMATVQSKKLSVKWKTTLKFNFEKDCFFYD